MKYDYKAVEAKWQKVWEDEKTFHVEIDHKKPKFYALVEFPYPSGAGLHVGHPRSYTALDVVSRKRRKNGYNVLYPMGWDAFGLPTENFAMKNHIHPAIVTKKNVDHFRQQLKALGVSVLVTQAVDTSVASGAVIRTDPAAGTQVAAGSTVILYISRPQVSTTTKVPSLTGMSVDDARTLLVQNHLGLGSQSEEYSDQPAGTVLSQNPAAGTTAKLNSRVNVVVSAGVAPAQEPEQPGSDGTSGTTGEGSTGGESTGGSSEPSSSSSSTGGGILDWWSSLLG